MHDLINFVIPYLINIFEFMGIVVLSVSAIKAFYAYILSLFYKKDLSSFKYQFANSMATALEFKLAAEILKTVIVRTVDEIIILAAIIILRAIMSIIIHLEIKSEHDPKTLD